MERNAGSKHEKTETGRTTETHYQSESSDVIIYRSLDDKLWKETLMPREVQTKPGGKVVYDIFTADGEDYMVTVDYFFISFALMGFGW